MNYTKLKSFIRRALNSETQEQYPILFDEKAWDKLQRDFDRDLKKAWKLAGVSA